jgi:CTP:molybdopterin cytidylyltransferase MocA
MFCGEPSLVHVLRALAGAAQVGRICVVGPRERLRRLAEESGLAAGVSFVEGGDSLVGSIEAGLADCTADTPVLLTTADLPLLTTEAVDEFVTRCQSRETFYDENVFISGVDRRAFTGRWARAPLKFLPFPQQSVVHGNLALISPSLRGHELVRNRLSALYRLRKNPLLVCFAFGWRIALAYLIGACALRLVSLRRLAGMISAALGVGLVPVKLNHPGIALDIDEAKDYRFVKQLMEQPRRVIHGGGEGEPV